MEGLATNETAAAAAEACDEASFDDAHLDEPLSEEDQRTKEKLKAELLPAVQNATEEAIDKILRAAQSGKGLQGFNLDQASYYKLMKHVREDVHTGMHRGPGKENVYLPYQDLLPKDLVESIDAGETGLVKFCNSAYGEKRVPRHVLSSLAQCRIPGNLLAPMNVRKLNSKINNQPLSDTRGDQARFITWWDLWDGVSPWSYNETDDRNTARFSLPTAMITMRSAANPNIPDLDSWLYYDHPENNVSTDVEGRLHHSGNGFTSTKRVAESWNAMLHRHHGSPEPGTPDDLAAEAHYYTPDDVKLVLGAISRIVDKDPEEAKKQASLFYVNMKTPPRDMHPKTLLLQRPVATIDSDETLHQRKCLHTEFSEGGWQDAKIAVSPVTAPPNPNKAKAVSIEDFTSPCNYK